VSQGTSVERLRRGYTLTEMLIVVGVVGLLTLFSLPKFSKLAERNRLSAARDELATAIATARAAAVQKGRTATLFLSGNKMWVTVVTSDAGTTSTVVPVKSFGTLYNVSVAAQTPSGLTSVTFDGRGFASPRLSATGKFLITGTSKKDSLCITTAGQLMPKSCSL
jgi:prepilin-type N-terminal cleavage/methylation domain-containing protein